MSLYTQLQTAKSEEDVKDAYIKALGLKQYTKGLIDIQTREIWFEAKDTDRNSSYAMFTQLLHYVQVALNKGEPVPPFLAVIDTEKAAIMKSADVLPFLAKKTIQWGKSASQYTPEALDEISAHIGTYFVSFKMSTHEDEFISTVKAAIKSGDIIRTQITPDNLKQVFDKWVAMVGREIVGVSEEDYALLFFADIMHDGTVSTHANLPAELMHKNGAPVFSLGGKNFDLGNKEGYRQFWAIYHRPPKSEYRDYLLERRDSLIPLDERSFKGAYYTPLHVVDKAYDKLTETLGANWQKDYIVWDMCCGVGNLEVKHSNPRNLYMSTLDQADIDVMKATKTCVSATRFQYDYLNDDITDDGRIDYSLSNKVPQGLRDAIAAGKKILVLINPPYAEAANSQGNEGKTDVAKTRMGALMNKANYGYAAREVFVQFLARMAQEIPTATLAMFSTLKYVNAPNFEQFREKWNSKYLGGFVVHSKSFDGLKGDFPIGFLVWKTDQNASQKLPLVKLVTDVLDKNAVPIGAKSFYPVSSKLLLSEWIDRLKKNDVDVIPLINAVTPIKKISHVRNTKWSANAIGHFFCNGNDLQNAGTMTALFSSVHSIGHAGGYFVTAENLYQAAIVFCVRRIIKPTWLNDRDQFLQPTEPLTDEFKTDCLLWMLFNGSNLTASANDLEWNGKKWSIVNHFIPFTEAEVNAPDRFESDFMVQYLAGMTLSTEATAVLDAGRTLWKAYFAHTDVRTVRDQYKLNRADVGWYQIRNALAERNKSGDTAPVNFSPFEAAYQALTAKLRPQVFSLGFLR
ncbi:hypothetical protein [Limnohabitans sp. Rim47]|uniref:hypothetical protein n=1 Tax=Limnohabitans sp. Rim47 TaxID=1100721 RepID=UPI0003179431|nr:hypothetical protein [Limnohabitans sp. Rim47]